MNMQAFDISQERTAFARMCYSSFVRFFPLILNKKQAGNCSKEINEQNIFFTLFAFFFWIGRSCTVLEDA